MYGSNLIFGGNKKDRYKKLEEMVKAAEPRLDLDKTANVDVKIIQVPEDKKSIGISEVKEGITFLQERPFSIKKKFLIILDAERLTREAQNSLLKTLEEPPTYAQIFLLAKVQNSVLETILSRCRKIEIKTKAGEEEGSDFKMYQEVVQMPIGHRLSLVDDLAKEEKSDIVVILESWISQARNTLIQAKTRAVPLALAENIDVMLSIKNDLENTNVNTKMALENLLINLVTH